MEALAILALGIVLASAIVSGKQKFQADVKKGLDGWEADIDRRHNELDRLIKGL